MKYKLKIDPFTNCNLRKSLTVHFKQTLHNITYIEAEDIF